jgi:hypothetical protein
MRIALVACEHGYEKQRAERQDTTGSHDAQVGAKHVFRPGRFGESEAGV